LRERAELVLEQLEVAAQRAQWVAQIVDDQRSELALLLLRDAQRLGGARQLRVLGAARQERPQASVELENGNRLGQKAVAARREAAHPLLDAVAIGDQKHRQKPGAAPGAALEAQPELDSAAIADLGVDHRRLERLAGVGELDRLSGGGGEQAAVAG